eukprot:TRINITY_DN5765_c0_g1_i1.p1 TRINITY_DN5765_c0_g1~~TRINITY_DN5765_c0_g1_i1.p1  ORF type:complete len:1217 (+),score=205.78 TRINITY_DN5765_c0_g1_i1:1973-5623(+)
MEAPDRPEKSTVAAEGTNAPAAEEKATAVPPQPNSVAVTPLGKKGDKVQASWFCPAEKVTSQHFYSPEFTAGKYQWRILVLQWTHQNSEWLACFLDCVDAHSFPEYSHNGVYAEFYIELQNKSEGIAPQRCQDTHNFTRREYDRGQQSWIPMAKALDPVNGWLHDIGGVPCFRISAWVRPELKAAIRNSVVLNPTQFGWSVGLENQGATCYLNSLLQVLFHIPYFRHAVYKIPTADESTQGKAKKSVPLALQRLFCRMQTSETAVGTKELTQSFGWTDNEAWEQHDVQELLRLLSDSLEGRMKSVDGSENAFKIFEGKTKQYIQCVGVEDGNCREEVYSDIQLCVADCKDVYESLNREIKPERLDGDNKYKSDKFGLVDAIKGVCFSAFPPVIFFHLKRFEYDPQVDRIRKINKRYEFQDMITLKPNVMPPIQLSLGSPQSDSTDSAATSPVFRTSSLPEPSATLHQHEPADEENAYELFAVLVHTGSVLGGHYYAYIRCQDPEDEDAKWVKYNDDMVSIATTRHVFDDNFGGKSSVWGTGDSPQNAYMLVYVKKAERDQLFKSIPEDVIPPHVLDTLKRELEDEKRQAERMKQEREEKQNSLEFRLITDQHVREWHAKDLQSEFYFSSNHETVRFRKDGTAADFKQFVAARLSTHVEAIRLWQFKKRDATYRPYVHISGDAKPPLSKLFEEEFHYYSRPPIDIYVEQPLRLPSSDSEIQESLQLTPLSAQNLLVFLKWFDPSQQCLAYLGSVVVEKTQQIKVLASLVNRLVDRPSQAPLDVYQEVDLRTINKLSLDDAFNFRGIERGDIFVFQKPPDPPDKSKPSHPLDCPTVDKVFALIRQKVVGLFYPYKAPRDPLTTITLFLNMDYAAVCQKLAQHLGLRASHIRLWAPDYNERGPDTEPVDPESKTIRAMLPAVSWSNGRPTRKIMFFYEELPVPLSEMLNKLRFSVDVFDSRVQRVSSHPLLMDKRSLVGEMLFQVHQQVGNSVGERLHLLVIRSHRIVEIYPSSSSKPLCEVVGSTLQLRVEEVPETPSLEPWDPTSPPATPPARKSEEELTAAGCRLVKVYHVSPVSPYELHSDPFVLWVAPKETAAHVRERIRLKLGKPVEEMKRWPLGVIVSNNPQPTQLKDAELVVDTLRQKEDRSWWSFSARRTAYLCLLRRDPGPGLRGNRQLRIKKDDDAPTTPATESAPSPTAGDAPTTTTASGSAEQATN